MCSDTGSGEVITEGEVTTKEGSEIGNEGVVMG